MISDVKKIFGLDESEMLILQRCLQNDVQNPTKWFLVEKIWNSVKPMFIASDWQVAFKVLEKHAVKVIRNHFDSQSEDSAWEAQGRALSEFLLKYLITYESYKSGQNQFLISASDWKKDQMDHLTLMEIIDRAPFGNGQTLPVTHRILLIRFIKKEREALLKEIENFEHYIKDDYALQAVEQVLQFVLQQADQIKKVSTKVNQSQTIIQQMRKIIQDMSIFDNEHQLSFINYSTIKEILKNLRQTRQDFTNMIRAFHLSEN